MPALRKSKRDLVKLLAFRPMEIDDLSSVRHLHVSSFRAEAGRIHSANESDAFIAHVYSPRYAEELLSQDMLSAWIDDVLVGTAGWCPAGNSGHAARITDVFVRPLFNGHGIGRALVDRVEVAAAKAGFDEYTARVLVSGRPFFERLGYRRTSQGVRNLDHGVDIPVVFMRKSPLSIARH